MVPRTAKLLADSAFEQFSSQDARVPTLPPRGDNLNHSRTGELLRHLERPARTPANGVGYPAATAGHRRDPPCLDRRNPGRHDGLVQMGEY